MPVLERMQPTSGNKFGPTKLLAALLFAPLSLTALMMTHTPAHPTEIFSHAPKREWERDRGRERGEEKARKRSAFFTYRRKTPKHTFCSHVPPVPACSVYSGTCAHQHSIWLPAGRECVWCFCTARPVSASRIYLGKQFCYLRPREA